MSETIITVVITIIIGVISAIISIYSYESLSRIFIKNNLKIKIRRNKIEDFNDILLYTIFMNSKYDKKNDKFFLNKSEIKRIINSIEKHKLEKNEFSDILGYYEKINLLKPSSKNNYEISENFNDVIKETK